MKILQILVLMLVLSVWSLAQIKIAVIDTEIFYDEKDGIKELVNARQKLQSQMRSTNEKLQVETDKFKRLSNEVEEAVKTCKIKCSTKLIDGKIEELEKFVKSLKSKTHDAELEYEMQKAEIVEPVIKKVAEKIKIFAKNKNYPMVFDISKESSFITCDPCNDITKEFIQFCNQEFEKEKAQNK